LTHWFVDKVKLPHLMT